VAASASYVALLRAVNLGSYNKVSMADLRGLLERLGLDQPRSLLQSGNLVFRAAGKEPAALERLLELETERQLGLGTEYFVRTERELRGVIDANPFPDEALGDPAHLLVVFFKQRLEPARVSALQAAIKGRERVQAHGREAYVVYPDGIGRSRVAGAVLEKALGGRGTGRNWNTILKLAELT
jgi:uncharacterized protein (DUF1697 family)